MLELLILAEGNEVVVGATPLPVTRFPCVVGRQTDCGLCLPAPTVSRRHCELRLHDGQVWVQDLGSRNGTRLNGEPLTAGRRLEDGDRLELAGLPFRVHLAEPAGVVSGSLHASFSRTHA